MLPGALRRGYTWLEDRLGLVALFKPMLEHLVPSDARWWYVFGSATMAAFMIQVFSGVALAFSYVPSAAQAYDALQFITHHAAFGRFMRGLHYYGASALVLMVGIHMAQVFVFGSYKYPREMNWVTGSLLLHLSRRMGGLRHTNARSSNTGWRNASFRGFADYMQTPEFEHALEELVQLARREQIALMCTEAVPWRCHRSMIADVLVIRGIQAEDIMSINRRQIHLLTPFAEVKGTRVTDPPEDSTGTKLFFQWA